MTDALVDELVALLRLERLEDNLFRGESRDIGTHRVFGGQVLGQALSAAQQTVDPERGAHSLHAYFLRAGDIAQPIVYNVERTRDGGSFSVRRVVAIQHGQPIFNCSVSFQIAEPGVEHQLPMPAVPKPDDLPSRPMIPPEELALHPGEAAALARDARSVRVPPRLSARRAQSRQAAAVSARLVPADRHARRTTSCCIARCSRTHPIST